MKRWAVLMVLMCGLAGLARGAEAPGGAAEVDAAWMKAMKANDLEGIVACYAADAIAWLPGMAEAKGTEAIRAAYKGLMDANTVVDVKSANVRVETVRDRSVCWGTFTLILEKKGGEKVAVTIMTGRFTEVCEKRDGKWVYVVDHASADPEMKAKAGPDAPK